MRLYWALSGLNSFRVVKQDRFSYEVLNEKLLKCPLPPCFTCTLAGTYFGKRCSILEGFSRRVDRRVEVFGLSLQKRLEIRTESPIFICNFPQAAAAILITHFKVLPSVPCLCVKHDEIKVVHPRCVAFVWFEG